MKILHIIENIDESYGGPAKSVPYLCKYLQHNGVEVSINSVKIKKYEENIIIKENFIQWNNYKNSFSDFFKYSTDLKKGLAKQVKKKDIILHTQNQWNYPSYCAFKLSKKYNVPLVCSVRGSLYSWSLNQYKYIKKIFWHSFQKQIFKNASCIHVTEFNEYQAVRNLGINTPVAIIPNGVELDEFKIKIDKQYAREKLNLKKGKKYILFISRIHPKKGLEYLVSTWSKLAYQYNNWDMIIAGPVDDKVYFDRIKRIINNANLDERVLVTGMLNQNERLNAYFASDLFVLPSHTENFGIVIAEAMAAGLPVITTTGTPWKEINDNSCGWWIDLFAENIKNALIDAFMFTEKDLQLLGENGRNLIFKKYSWIEQTEKMIAVYKWLLGEAEKPFFVYTD